MDKQHTTRVEHQEPLAGRGALTGSGAMQVVASAVEGGLIGIGTGIGLKVGDKLLGNSPTP
jgi:hypothetical protein